MYTLDICIYINMYIFIYVCTFAYPYIYKYIHMCIYTCTCTAHAHAHIISNIHMYASTYMCDKYTSHTLNYRLFGKGGKNGFGNLIVIAEEMSGRDNDVLHVSMKVCVCERERERV